MGFETDATPAKKWRAGGGGINSATETGCWWGLSGGGGNASPGGLNACEKKVFSKQTMDILKIACCEV